MSPLNPKCRPGRSALRATALALAAVTTSLVHAAPLEVTITVENLAPTNSVSFAPLHFGFHSGVFDAFDNGTVAAPGIVSVAEGGSGSVWQPDFAAADPTATRGTIGGALLPGQMRSLQVTIDPTINRFFTFATMVIPSNDLFLGNDGARRFQVIDERGVLLIDSIDQSAAAIWDAGSETADPTAAAFVVGGTNSARTPEGGVVSFERSELDAFNGLQTAAGYTFDSTLLGNDSPIYRISFRLTNPTTAVPTPGALAVLPLGALGLLLIRRNRRCSQTLRSA